MSNLFTTGTNGKVQLAPEGVVAADDSGLGYMKVVPVDVNGNMTAVTSRTVSATNTQQQVVVDMADADHVLAIVMVCSAGTATLTVESSTDNTNWITVDSATAAASTAKNYGQTTVGATTAVSPLAFRYVRVTAGAAGAGDTTTLTISAK